MTDETTHEVGEMSQKSAHLANETPLSPLAALEQRWREREASYRRIADSPDTDDGSAHAFDCMSSDRMECAWSAGGRPDEDAGMIPRRRNTAFWAKTAF